LNNDFIYNLPKQILQISKFLVDLFSSLDFIYMIFFHQEAPISCDFEGNICGFNQSFLDDFDWWIEKPMETQHLQKPRLDSRNSTKGTSM
jgi:hypothetical protein